MAMEPPLMTAEAPHSCSLVLSLPQHHAAFFSRALSLRGSLASQRRPSVRAKTVAPRTAAKGQKCRDRPLCHCSIGSSVLSTDQSLDFSLSVGSAMIPHPAKVGKGGEDAFFVSSHNGGTLGIADGVSGWAEENVDPALFSRELVEHAVTALNDALIDNCPRQLLAKASQATSAIGAATAIVAILEREGGALHIANLGDCGLRLVRKGRIVFATSTQQHYFDCPYQLSSEPGAQTAVDATVYKVEVFPGDIIVMGSDGLFDNVYDTDIEKTVSFLSSFDNNSSQKIASALAALASKHAKDTKYESPYSKEAISQGYDVPLWKKVLGQKLTGGKLDDITILAALVVATPSLPKGEPVTASEGDHTSIPPVPEEASVVTPSLPKGETVEGDHTSIPPVQEEANVVTSSLPTGETVVARDDTSVTPVQEPTNGNTPPSLPEVEPVVASEGHTSEERPVVSQSDRVLSLPPAQETTNVDTPPSLPKVEAVISSEVDASPPLPAQQTTNIDMPSRSLPSGEAAVSSELDGSLCPAQEATNGDKPPSSLLEAELAVYSEGDTSVTSDVGTPPSLEPVVAGEGLPAVEDQASTDSMANQVLAPAPCSM